MALAIFALIGVAGFSMLDQVLRTQRLTEGRLERLAELQRAMHLITLDFSQARGASVDFMTGPEGSVLALRRNAVQATGGSVDLQYAVQDGGFVRQVSTSTTDPPMRQPLLRDVTGVEWQFYDPIAGWADVWPPISRTVLSGQAVPNPQAITITITLATDGNQLRRVVLLPGEVR